jgi:hypothetical protein
MPDKSLFKVVFWESGKSKPAAEEYAHAYSWKQAKESIKKRFKGCKGGSAEDSRGS